MIQKRYLTALLATSACLAWWPADRAAADDLLPKYALDRLGVQTYWQSEVPLANGESIVRIVLLDDNLYLLTEGNRAYAVHARTGVLRWSALVADSGGQTVRGPTHSDPYVLFTAPGSVKVLDRRSGELAGEPRKLRGFIVEVMHDTATISIGELHGVRADDVLSVVRVNPEGLVVGDPLARLRITVVKPRSAKGRLIRASRSTKITPGDRVRGDVILPLKSVKLPFAASSPAVADDKDLFIGAGNQRFYSLKILTGFENWQIMTPRTVSATPVLVGANIYLAGQDGRVISCTKRDRVRNWVFKTEGPIFADLAVTRDHVYAASADRQLYCLDRKSGRRIWRKRFDNPPTESPRIAGGRLYQSVPKEGLFVLDASTGATLWRRPQGGRFLAELEADAFIIHRTGAGMLFRVDAATGSRKAAITTGSVDFAAASQRDQLILLATRQGRIVCLRPKSAPRLRPAELADVLRNDRKLRGLARLTAAAKASRQTADAGRSTEARTRPSLEFLEPEDFLRSRSTARPAGGSGLAEVEPADQAEPAKASGAEGEDEDDEDADEDEDDMEDGDDEEDEDIGDDSEDDEDDEDIDDDDADDTDDEDIGDDDSDDDDEDDDDEEDDDGDDEDDDDSI